jgi:hypothetical protein
MPRGKPPRNYNTQKLRSKDAMFEFGENTIDAAKNARGLKTDSLAKHLLGIGKQKDKPKNTSKITAAKIRATPAGKHKADSTILSIFKKNKSKLKTFNELYRLCKELGIPHHVSSIRVPVLKTAGLLPPRLSNSTGRAKNSTQEVKRRQRSLFGNPYKAFSFQVLVKTYKSLKGNSSAERKSRQQIREVVSVQFGNNPKKGIAMFRAQVKPKK